MSKATPLIQRPSVLLVEDDIRLRRAMLFLMEIGGYAVVAASDGMNALEMLQLHTPDIIISDIDMPHMDGYELLRIVRSSQSLRAIPFIVASERYEYEDFMLALDMGANDYLPKPFDTVEMLTTIDRTLAMYASQSPLKYSA